MKNQPFLKKVTNAVKGISYALKSENNFRIQILIAVLIIGIGLPILQPTLIWSALLILCIGLVLAAELVNTALEVLLDYLHPEIHPEIAKIKDIMAGMVLILSLTSVFIAGLALIDTLGKS